MLRFDGFPRGQRFPLGLPQGVNRSARRRGGEFSSARQRVSCGEVLLLSVFVECFSGRGAFESINVWIEGAAPPLPGPLAEPLAVGSLRFTTGCLL